MLNVSNYFNKRASAPSKFWRLGISLPSIMPLLAAFDAALIVLSSVAGGAGYQLFIYSEPGDVEVYFGVGIVVSLIYVSAARIVGLYDLHVLLAVQRFYWRVVLCWLLAI